MPTYVATGGNPGGFLRTADISVSVWTAYHAPAAFLGNQSAAYGGTLSLDQQLLTSDGVNYPMVVLSNGPLLLQFRTPPPGTTWTSYNIPLMASAGWEIADGSGNPGPAATELQLQQVLTNLSFLHLDADWRTGPDQVDLDNVRLASSQVAVPEPGSFTLCGLGILGLLGYARFRLKEMCSRATSA